MYFLRIARLCSFPSSVNSNELRWGWSVEWHVDDLFDLVDEVVRPVGRRLLDVADVSLGRQ